MNATAVSVAFRPAADCRRDPARAARQQVCVATVRHGRNQCKAEFSFSMDPMGAASRERLSRRRPRHVAGLSLRTASPVERIALRRRVYRSEEHTSELQSLMRISYAVFCLNKKK